MTNKTEMVSVPREVAQELDDLLYILTSNNSSQKLVRKYGAAFWLKLDELRIPLCKALSAPAEDVREVGDEPVGYAQTRDLEKIYGRNVIHVGVLMGPKHQDGFEPLYRRLPRRD